METTELDTGCRSAASDAWPYLAPVIHADGIDGMSGPVHVHGVGVLDGELIHAGRLPAVRPASGDLGMALRGVVALSIGREALLPDPLGGSMTFIWESGRNWAVSSDLHALVDWLSARGRPPHKSPLYAALIAALGQGCFGLTSYNEIRALPTHRYLTFEGRRFVEHRYPVDDYLHADAGYDEALEAAAAEILGNIRAVATSGFSHRIVHLTGGFDSRLVTAACRRAGLEFVSFCSGPLASQDKLTSLSICAELDLPMTHRPGYIETRMAPSLRARLVDEMSSVSGMTPQIRLGCDARGAPGAIVLSGGFGERLRARTPLRGDESPVEFGRLILGPELFPVDGQRGMFSPATRMVVQSLLEQMLESLDVPVSERPESFRRRSRSAYSVGLTTSRVSQAVPRFDPLYSLAAIRASVACGAAGRRVNRVHFDLMNRFDATLASFPFWEGGWAPELGASVRPFRRGHKPRFVDFPEDPVPLWPGERRPPSADQLATIRRTRANAWQVVHLAETQRMCQELLPEARDLAAGFDPLMLKRLFAREPAHRSHYRLLHQLASVLAWYCSGEGQA